MAHVTRTDPPRPVGVVLAAGEGSRLRPLTRLRPKALCPVGDRALVDHALDRLAPAVDDVAVNVHHGRLLMEAHLTGRDLACRPHLSIEDGEARGTAGALGLLHEWIDGRDVLLTNADAWVAADTAGFVAGWDRERIRLLCVRDEARGDFGSLRYCGVALLPWSEVAPLGPEPSGLYERSWAQAERDGRLDLVIHDGAFVDCGTVADYLEANLLWSGGASVIGPGAQVAPGARVERSVLWPGAVVLAGEVLVDAVRAGDQTVLVRPPRGPGT
jgi:NDP-sugar pyrophosphorylase family protein